MYVLMQIMLFIALYCAFTFFVVTGLAMYHEIADLRIKALIYAGVSAGLGIPIILIKETQNIAFPPTNITIILVCCAFALSLLLNVLTPLIAEKIKD